MYMYSDKFTKQIIVNWNFALYTYAAYKFLSFYVYLKIKLLPVKRAAQFRST